MAGARIRTIFIVACAACLRVGLPLHATSRPVPNPMVTSPASPSLTIGSLNMAKKNTLAEVSKEIAALFSRNGVDVLVLQEVDRNVRDHDVIAAVLGRTLGLSWQFAPADVWTDREEGLAILSRYPLDAVETIPLKHFDLHGHQRTRIALGATVATPLGSVHVIDVHLDSRINPGERLEQLAPVLESAARSAERCVIAGDFNTTDYRFLGRWLPIPAASRQQHAVTQTMAAVGFETPFLSTGATFKHLGLKLDWIFARRLRPEAWGIVPIRFSDHHAIWTRMS